MSDPRMETHDRVQVGFHAFLVQVDRVKVDGVDEVEVVQAGDLCEQRRESGSGHQLPVFPQWIAQESHCRTHILVTSEVMEEPKGQ